MRVTLSFLLFAALIPAQVEETPKPAKDPVSHLLAMPLEKRAEALKNLDLLLKQIDAGIKEADSHEAIKEELKAPLQGQRAQVLELQQLGAVPTAESVGRALAGLKDALEIPPRIAAAAEKELLTLQPYLSALTKRDAELRNERKAADAALAAVDKDELGASALLEAVRESRDSTQKAAADVAADIKTKEESGAATNILWPAREAAFATQLTAQVANGRFVRRQAELSSEVLGARKGVAQRAVARFDDALKAVSTELGRVNELVRELESNARLAREGTRGSLQAALADAAKFEKGFLELKIANLDAEDARDEATRLQTEWVDRISNGQIKTDLEEAANLRRDLEETEDREESTDELRARIEENQERLARLQSTLSEVLDARKTARASRTDADRTLRSVSDLAERKAEAEAAAPGPDASRRERGYWEHVRTNWDDAVTNYEKVLRDWRKAASDFASRANDTAQIIGDAESILEKDIGALRSILLWTRQDSKITGAAVQRALNDSQDFPDHAMTAARATFDEWKAVATAEKYRGQVIAMGIVAVLLTSLLIFVHKKLPRTYSWLERREQDADLFRVLAAGVRRSELVFFVALIYCGMCAVWRLWPWETGVIAVLALAPFCYRFLRVLLDVLFHPTDEHHRLIDVDDVLARALHRAGRWLLNLSLIFGTVGLLMKTGGYADWNPGFAELWWFLYQSAFSLVLLVGVCRPSVIRRMITGNGRVAASVQALILVLYPLIVSAVLYLMVLNALRYKEAVTYFRMRFLATAGVLAVSFFVFRFLQRRALPDRDWKRTVDADDYEDDQQFMAEGRRWFYDTIARFGLRLLVGVPAILFLAGVWRRMDWGFLDVPIFGADGSLTGGGLIWGLLSIWITITVLKHYRRWVKFVVLPATTLDQGLGYAVLTLSSYVVLAIGLVISLNLLEVQGDQIAVVLSALMVGIGFGLKDLVTNFICGIMLLVERPLKVGDQVKIGDDLGTVEKINLRSTTIMTFDNIGVVVPNADLVTGKLINRSSGTPLLRTVIPVGVGYDSDVRQVMEIIQGCLDDHGLVLKKPGPSIYFVGFGDNSLDFSVRFWAKMSDNRMQVAGDLRAALLARFREADIEIPFPQRDLHLRGVDHEVVMKTSAVEPPRGPRKTRVDAGPVALPEQPSDEDAQRAASEDAAPDSGAETNKDGNR